MRSESLDKFSKIDIIRISILIFVGEYDGLRIVRKN